MFFPGIGKQVKFLSIGFALIFFGYASVAQYLTIFFKSTNSPDAGFISLILTYLFFTLACPFAPIFISKLGNKMCMITASAFYGIYIFSLLFSKIQVVYFASITLGISAAILWVSQSSFLVRNSDKNSYGANSGFFTTVWTMGTGIGLLTIGYLLQKMSYQLVFLLYGLLPFLGILVLTLLKDPTKTTHTHINLSSIFKPFKSKTALSVSSFYIAFSFVSGLMTGIIPITIKNSLGISYVGLLFSVYYLMPIFVSYTAGRISDKIGRKKLILFSYLTLVLGVSAIYFGNVPMLLILGVVFLSVSSAVFMTARYALIGDVSTDADLNSTTAFFWTIQNISVTFSLIMSTIFQTNFIYVISTLVIITSLIILLPALRLSLPSLKSKIATETS